MEPKPSWEQLFRQKLGPRGTLRLIPPFNGHREEGRCTEGRSEQLSTENRIYNKIRTRASVKLRPAKNLS